MGKRILVMLLGVVLLALPWLGGTSLTLFVGLVPLLWIERDVADRMGRKGRPLRFWPYAVATFALWWAATAWWVSFAALIGAFAATLIGTVLMSTAFLIYHAVGRRAPRALAYTVLVAAWIAYEYLYTHNQQLSFPWLVLGNGFSADLRLVQWYEYTGVLGGSLWVLVVNLLVFEAWKRRRDPVRWIAPAVALVVPAVVSWVIYANYREQPNPVKISVLQPNIDPYHEKFKLSQLEQTQRLLNLMEQTPEDVRILVAPETAINEHFWETEIDESPSIVLFRALMQRRQGAMIVTGANTYRPYASSDEASPTARYRGGQWYDAYNSAIGIEAEAPIHIHHKSKLVAGAEMMPFYSLLRHCDWLYIELGGISGQYGVDTVRKVFVTAEGRQVGAAICYEAIYGEYFSEFARNGAQVMCVVSNDGWWGNTPGYRYLFNFSRLRAVETRRSIARSANTGISGFINQRGDVLQKLGWDRRGILTDTLNLNSQTTFYSRYGDWLGRVACYVLALSLLYFMSYSIRRRSHLEA